GEWGCFWGQFAIPEEGPVAGEGGGRGGERSFARLVRVFQQKFAHRQRGPLAVLCEFALPRLGILLHAQVLGIAKPICIAEVFLGRDLSIDLKSRGILRPDILDTSVFPCYSKHFQTPPIHFSRRLRAY